FALGAIGPDGAEGVPGLAAILEHDPDPEARHQASLSLAKMGTAARGALPALTVALGDDETLVRVNAVRALLHLGPEARPAVPAPDKGTRLELPEAERQYLWEVEHHGNLLVKHGFGRLARALRDGDAAALGRLLADDFAGSEPGRTRRVRADTASAEVERVE